MNSTVIVFVVLMLAVVAAPVAAIVEGWKTGELQTRVIEPLKETWTKTGGALAELSKVEPTATPSSQVRTVNQIIITNTSDTAETSTGQTIRILPPQYIPPSYTGKTYEQIKAEQDAWWQQAQAESNRLSEESKRQLEEFRAKSEQNYQQAVEQGQQGFADFEARMEQERQEFLQEHGITP